MLAIVVVMIVIVVLALGVLAFAAFRSRERELPHASWLSSAMAKASDALPVVETEDAPRRSGEATDLMAGAEAREAVAVPEGRATAGPRR